ncbi:hypothetical protein CEXT_775021 [Caerostris extrusa]|uniref:Uncharacterized protein n=1 Tax=Caerostris extrusa TaxID=172846 RepID=A0AAV4RGJ0_CAEEX|nr:hypothetical protein CEXT_775021 [Caerostris extrusa]
MNRRARPNGGLKHNTLFNVLLSVKVHHRGESVWAQELGPACESGVWNARFELTNRVNTTKAMLFDVLAAAFRLLVASLLQSPVACGRKPQQAGLVQCSISGKKNRVVSETGIEVAHLAEPPTLLKTGTAARSPWKAVSWDRARLERQEVK